MAGCLVFELASPELGKEARRRRRGTPSALLTERHLLARAEAGVCYPPNLLLYGILPPYPALDISILLTLVITGAGMYLYARQIGAARAGALIAGLSFSFSGFMVDHLKHLSMAATAAWMLVALWLHRCSRS
jgi:hypothetical protein